MKDDGGPAFPLPQATSDEREVSVRQYAEPGMSLRDWFAGQALTGLSSKNGSVSETTARIAYRYADAMLAERNKTDDG